MGYFQVRYDSRVVNYERRSFIRLTTGLSTLNILKAQLNFPPIVGLRFFQKGGGIAEWIRLRLPSCGPGFESKHTIYALIVKF